MGMPNVLKHFATFYDGNNYAGKVHEVTLPKLKRKMEDFRAGGMSGPVKVDLGNEGLEAEITAGGYLKEVIQGYGNARHDGLLLRFVGALQDDGTGQYNAVEVTMRGRHEELDFGNAKAADKTDFKFKMQLSYYKLVWNGATVIELDFINMIENVGGTDLLSEVRSLLGI